MTSPLRLSHAEPQPVVGWNVDCANHCFFSEFPNNCQGVFYYYPDGTKSYSSWSSNYNACQEFAPLQANTHIIAPHLIQCGCPTPSVHPPSNDSTPMTTATRNRLEVLRAQIQGWTLCTPDPFANYSNLFNPLSYRNLKTCQYFRKRRLENNYMSVGGCLVGLLGFEDLDWHPCRFPGDQLSNSVQNCMFDDQDRCSDIKDSLDPRTGMWYRTPFDRIHPEASNGQPLSSRDVLMGILGYVIKTKDKESMRKFLIFVRNNVKSPPFGLFNLCPPRPNIPKPPEVPQNSWDAMQFDDRCGLVPEAAGLIYKVAKAVGLSDAELNAIGTDLFSALSSGSLTVIPSISASAATAPATGGPAYQIGNVADGIFIHYLMGEKGNPTLANAANTVNNRTQKLNPGYHFLAKNLVATEYGAYLISKYCKPIRPQWGFWFKSGFQGQGNNSTGYWNSGEPFIAGNYQYAGGWGPYYEKIVPSGQECIAWLNMYLGNGNLTEARCEDGDVLLNGACRKFSFQKPTLAPIAGIDYKIRTSDARLHYQAIDMRECPYGGRLEYGNWPDLARCFLASGLSSSQLSASVNYWVDPNEKWPGIYYTNVNGTCPHGGIPAGPNCQIQRYSPPAISASVSYSVNTQPSTAGVYYSQINGACPYGGMVVGGNCRIQGFQNGFLNPNRIYFVRSNPAYPGVFYYPDQVVPETPIKRIDDKVEMKVNVETFSN